MDITATTSFQGLTASPKRVDDPLPSDDGPSVGLQSIPSPLQSPSVIVELSKTRSLDPSLYSNKFVGVPIEESSMVASTVVTSTVDSEFPRSLTQTLLSNQNRSEIRASSFEGVFSGLGELAENNRSQSQWVGKVYHHQSLQNVSMEALEKGRQSRDIHEAMELRITTKDGDEITFKVRALTDSGLIESGDDTRYSFSLNGVSLDFELDGELSKEEMDALERLGVGIETLYQSLGRTGGPDISGLNVFDSDLFSSIEVSFSDSGDESFFLSAQNTSETRSIEMSFEGNRVRMQINKSDIDALISEVQHRAAVSHYLTLIDDSVDTAHGSDVHRSLMGQTFSKMNEGIAPETGLSAPVNGQNNGSSLRINDTENALLTDLPDFELTFSSVIDRPNLLNGKPEEFSGFTLNMGQETQITDTRHGFQVSQAQNYELTAGYYRPLPGLEQVHLGAEYQSYQYFRIEEEHSKNIKQRFEHGESISVDVLESSRSSKEHVIYDYNTLTHHQIDKDKHIDAKTLNEKQVHQYQQDLLMLIDPDFLS